MKRPYFAAALLVLLGTNAWVLAHVALNRWGAPDAEMELTSRELEFRRGSGEDRGVTLGLRWQNPAPQYSYTPGFEPDNPGWFDQKKLEELGFDCSVPAADRRASRHYREALSREVFVALEYDGPAWQRWLAGREPALRTQQLYSSDLTFEQRLEIERATASRLVALDAAQNADALRRKYPDRAHVLILRGLAVMALEERRTTPPDKARAAYLRGAISRILIDAIYVPQPLSRFFDDEAGMDWSFNKGVLKVAAPRYAVGLRTGSRYEPWVTSARKR